MKKLQTLLVLVIALTAIPAFAQTASEMVQIKAELASIDTMPTREALAATFESPAAVLMTAARDASLTTYERKRAISLLSLFPSPQAQVFLGSLSSDPDAAIRGMAVYTVARTFGPIANDQTFEIIETGLRDLDPSVTIWALRGLRWVPGTRAEGLLSQWQGHSDPNVAKVAKSATSKRLRASTH